MSTYPVDPNGDLVIKVIVRNRDARDANGRSPIQTETLVQVNRSVLMESSDVFQAMLDGKFAEASMQNPVLEEDSITSLLVWLYRLHDIDFPSEKLGDVSIKDVWFTIELANKYFWKVEQLNAWFEEYCSFLKLSTLGIFEARELLYPCFEYEHHKGFALLTKKLAYDGVGHVTETNPTHHKHLHLRHGIIQQINASRASLRTKLHNAIHAPIKKLLGKTCPCKEGILFAYCKALDKAAVWPLEEFGHKKCINDLLEGLEDFSFAAPQAASCCERLPRSIQHDVEVACDSVTSNFDGLCMNCMDISKPKTDNSDEDYWMHERIQMYSRGCKFTHGQPTWYFSFMGRRERMMQFQKEKARRARSNFF